MAYNWNTRRSIVIHTQKVEDSREILKQYLSRNNFNDVAAIDQLMRNLEFESLCDKKTYRSTLQIHRCITTRRVVSYYI